MPKEEREQNRKQKLAQKRKETKKRSQQAKKERMVLSKMKKFDGKKPGDNVEIEYVTPELPFAEGDPKYEEYKRIFEQFAPTEEENAESGNEEEAPADKPSKPKPKLEMDDDSDEDSDEKKNTKGLSKRQKRLRSRMSVAKLKTLVRRPDVVEACDTTGPDPKLLVYLKAYRNTVHVPRHWSSKRRYLSGKRGVEKPPFKLPEFIEATGIQKIRQAIVERDQDRNRRASARMKLKPKAGKLDIDYQVLHDAFFKYGTKPKMTKHNELYFEGKEHETQMSHKKPGQLSAALKEALGMPDGHPPPWLYNMQRYGPPPSYPSLRIAGLNAPIPYGAEYGFHAGGWGKPPVDEFGQPLYGDFRNREPEPDYDEGNWGEMEDIDSDADEEDMDMERMDGTATPVMGTATPIIGAVTPMVGSGIQSITGTKSITGTRSISGVSSVTYNTTTPIVGSFTPMVTSGVHSITGARSISGVSSITSGVDTMGTGAGTRTREHVPMIGGIHTPGIATPGIATPIGGIATPIGGIATPTGGIITPVGVAATPVAGMDTPVNLNPSDVEAEGALTADIIRQQLKQHEEQAKKARDKAGQKETTKKKEKAKATKTSKKFKF